MSMIEIKEKEEVIVKELGEKEKIKNQKEERPYKLDAKIYKIKSPFVSHAIYVACSYIIDEKGKKKPFEIFINSKDLTKAAEYTMLTRLISAIFRRSNDPTFIIEELKGIYDPNGGYYKDGKYFPSIYAEIADVLEEFFEDIGLLERKKEKEIKQFQLTIEESFKICPKCNEKTLKKEGNCEICINEKCNYSKCD